MNERPKLNINLDSKTFKQYYYLKEELVAFCKSNGLQTIGSKEELNNRISKYLETGEITTASNPSKKTKLIDEITMESIIETNFVCSERHRAFYKEHIGDQFHFNVAFQQWLKNNSGKTYKDSVTAYYVILDNKKHNKTIIDKQFEYNTYIRDFFDDNKGKTLQQAIKCWNYKKSKKGHNKYKREDLLILDE